MAGQGYCGLDNVKNRGVRGRKIVKREQDYFLRISAFFHGVGNQLFYYLGLSRPSKASNYQHPLFLHCRPDFRIYFARLKFRRELFLPVPVLPPQRLFYADVSHTYHKT